MKIKIAIPSSMSKTHSNTLLPFNGDIEVKIINDNYGQNKNITNVIEFCGFAIAKVGKNIPCVHPVRDLTPVPIGSNAKNNTDGDYHEMYNAVRISNLCYMKTVDDAEEDKVRHGIVYHDYLHTHTLITIVNNLFPCPHLQITLETAIRVRPDVSDNEEFDITVDVKPVNPTTGWDQTLHLGEVKERLYAATPTAADIPTTAVAAADVALFAGLVNVTAPPVPISTARKVWLPFTITVPKYTVAPVTVRMTFSFHERLRVFSVSPGPEANSKFMQPFYQI